MGYPTAPSWEDIKGYIKSNYNSYKDGGNYVTVTISFTNDNNRSQLVLLDSQTSQSGNIRYLNFSSRVGAMSSYNVDKALEILDTKRFGKLVKRDGKYYIMHTLIMNYEPLSLIPDFIRMISELADDLEKAFVGGDAN